MLSGEKGTPFLHLKPGVTSTFIWRRSSENALGPESPKSSSLLCLSKKRSSHTQNGEIKIASDFMLIVATLSSHVVKICGGGGGGRTKQRRL